MNYGLIIPKIETREEGAEHILGAVEPVVLPDGNWLPYLVDREPQNKNGVETQACTVYATLTAIEEAIFRATGTKVNYSDRYIANVAKNRGVLNPYGGADPHKIAELIRTITGNLREDKCAWTDDVKSTDDYYNIVGQELANLMYEGTAWYKDWKLEHRWVWSGNPTPAAKRTLLQDALTKGSVCVSVDAWNKQGDLYVKLRGENHWTGLVRAEKDKPYKAFDSYDLYVKDLDPLYDFSIAKVYFLTPAPHVFLKNLGFQIMDEEVTYLQKALVKLGYSIPHAVTNVYGTETRSAVWQFQVKNGIADDGSHFGPRTRYAMNKTLNPTVPFGGSVWTYLASLFSGI